MGTPPLFASCGRRVQSKMSKRQLPSRAASGKKPMYAGLDEDAPDSDEEHQDGDFYEVLRLEDTKVEDGVRMYLV